MKLQDKETLSVAAAVQNVLEGKKPAVKEEPKYPHAMYHPKTGEEETANNEEEHKALSAKGYTHEKNESPEEPRAKGEKDFKAKHVVKKSGAKSDGSVVKEDVDALHEEAIEMDKELSEGYSPAQVKAAIKIAAKMGGNMTGAVRKIEAMKKGLSDEKAVKDALRLANEGTMSEEEKSAKQKKYQAFFNKALKKFGVKSPAELEGDKKKEFFDYIDKNYEADDEEDEIVSEGNVTVDVDWIGDTKVTKDAEKKFKVKIKVDYRKGTADVTGDHKQVIKMLMDKDVYGLDKGDIDDMFPGLMKGKLESVEEDVRDMKNFKDRDRKGYEARAYIEIKKGNTSNKFDDDFGFTKSELDQVDKLISKIKGMHVSSFDGGSSAPASLEFYGKKASLDKFASSQVPKLLAKKYKTKVEVFTNESVEEDVRDMKNFDDRNRKGFEARAYIEVKKGNTNNKFDDNFGFSKAEMQYMDKLISKIKGMHVSSFDGGSSGPASLEFYGTKASLDKFAKDSKVQQIAKKYKSKVEVFVNK